MKETTPRHIRVKMLKTKGKENILTAETKRYITYRGTMIRIMSDVSSGIIETKR